jgi:transposase
VQALVAAGYGVYAINPKAASRYRDRHHPGGAKSDAGDAVMLADLVRTDRHKHRLVAADSDLAEAVKVLARAHQGLIWARTRHTNMLRAGLREYFPAALATFDDLAHRDTVAVLNAAATPTAARALTVTQLVGLLRRAGRQRNLEVRARQIHDGLHTPALAAPGVLADALAVTTRAQLGLIAEINTQIAALEASLADHFDQHPDTEIYRSLPGLGIVLGARVLGEFGDAPDRYADAKSRRNAAGSSPLTRASGKTTVITARWIRNPRLADATMRWAQAALLHSPGAHAYYRHRRRLGDGHNAALRALANRLVGILHGCLRTHTPYNEHKAWAHRNDNPHTTAA